MKTYAIHVYDPDEAFSDILFELADDKKIVDEVAEAMKAFREEDNPDGWYLWKLEFLEKYTSKEYEIRHQRLFVPTDEFDGLARILGLDCGTYFVRREDLP